MKLNIMKLLILLVRYLFNYFLDSENYNVKSNNVNMNSNTYSGNNYHYIEKEVVQQ